MSANVNERQRDLSSAFLRGKELNPGLSYPRPSVRMTGPVPEISRHIQTRAGFLDSPGSGASSQLPQGVRDDSLIELRIS
jgi:hypothetical protein